MSNFDDKNLFDDDFDLLSESADNLFGQPASKPSKNEEKNETKNNDIKEQPVANSQVVNKDNNEKQKTATENEQEIKIDDSNLNDKPTKTKKSKDDNKVKSSNNKETKKDLKVQEDNKQSNIKNNDLDNSQDVNLIQIEQDTVLDKKNETKTKKQKPQKEKKKINKLMVILLIVVVVILAVVITCLSLYIKKITTKLATPTYEIYQRDVGTIINIDKVDNALGYEITMCKEGLSDAIFKSTSTVVEIKSYLNKAGEFNVKIRALGKTDKATSDYSEIKTVVNNIALDTPNVFRDGNIISWNPVAKAVNYKIYYGVNFNADTVSYKIVEQNNNIINFDLTTLNEYGAGAYPIYVQAITDEQFYLNSGYSKTIVYEYYEKTQDVLQPIFNLSSKKLTFMLDKSKYIPNSCLVEFLLEKNSGDVSHLKIKHLIMLNELEKIETTYNSLDVVKYVADFKELIDGDVVNITITSVADNSYLQDSNKIIVVVE